MRRVCLAVSLLLVVAACGGGAETTDGTAAPSTSTTSPTTTTTAPTTTTTDPGFTVMSDDGRVSLEVTSEALSGDPVITITALTPDDHPADLAALDFTPSVYALEPAHQQFDEPVRVTVSVPIGEIVSPGFEATLPVATLIVTSDDGAGWQFVDDLRITRDETDLIVSGLIDHFSRLAMIPEQITIESRFVEVTQDRTMTLGFDFLWSNGVGLMPPSIGAATFEPFDGQTGQVPVSWSDGLATLTCPPNASSVIGDLSLTALLDAVSDSSGQTGLTAAPQITTLQGQQAAVTVSSGLKLLCRPTITDTGSIAIDLQVDHPGGGEIVPGGDFKNGLSALYMHLGTGLPPMFVGLIRDVDGDGQVGPNDIMYPPEATDITDGISTATLPLFGYGDYFPYFIADLPSALDTEVLVRDGASILLGGLTREETAIPYLDGVPFLARVFSDESRQTANTDLVILVTPTIIEDDGE